MSDIVERLQKWRANFGNMPGGRMLDEASAEIARLAAEVERHRMTDEERNSAEFCAAFSFRPDESSARLIHRYLDRTAQKEVGRE